MKKISIIGGIGSGKSYICRLFADHMPVLYFDEVAKKSYELDSVVDKMLDAFGQDIYDWSNPYNPKLIFTKLADIIFNDDFKRKKVENILKPELMKMFLDKCYHYEYINPSPLFFTESATIMKTDMYKIFDEFIIIDAEYEKRKEMNLVHRGMPNDEFDRRCKIQISISDTIILLKQSNIKYTLFHNKYNNESEEFVLDFMKSNI